MYYYAMVLKLKVLLHFPNEVIFIVMYDKIIKNSSIIAAYSQTEIAVWLILMQCRRTTMTYHCTKFRLLIISQTLAMDDFVTASLIEAV